MGDSQLVQLTQVPDAFVDKPTLLIPSDICTVQPSFFEMSISASKKGKERALSPTLDMDVDDDSGDLKSGKIIATKGSYVTVLEQSKNIAPIMDACLVDLDGGQVSSMLLLPGRAKYLMPQTAADRYVFWREKLWIHQYRKKWC